MNLRSIQGVGLPSNIIYPIPDGSITELRHVAGYYAALQELGPDIILAIGGPIYTTDSEYLDGRIYHMLATSRILSEAEINLIFGLL